MFERHVWTDPSTCNECFAHIKDVYELEYWRGDREEHYRTDEAELGYDEVQGAYRPRTFCSSCGGRGQAWAADLTLEEMLERVPTLLDRVDEAGIAIHRDALYAGVRQFKSIDQFQGLDKEIYGAAVWFAVEWARGNIRSGVDFRRRLTEGVTGGALPELFDPSDPDRPDTEAIVRSILR